VRVHKELYIHPDGRVLLFTIERAVKIIVRKRKNTETKVMMECSYVSRICCGPNFVCFSTIKLEATSTFVKEI